jgi:hypothetical protein
MNKEQGILNKELAPCKEKSRSLLYSIFLVPCSIFYRPIHKQEKTVQFLAEVYRL